MLCLAVMQRSLAEDFMHRERSQPFDENDLVVVAFSCSPTRWPETHIVIRTPAAWGLRVLH